MQDTIIALATPAGSGAIAVIRLSGPNAIAQTNAVFKGKDLSQVAGHTIHFGTIRNEQDNIIDEVLISLFIGPKSFTGEDSIEISCHGSPFIISEIISLFQRAGLRHALPGEFTQRAFLHGRMDLAQAEAVADIIAADSAAAHKAALNQLRGGFSNEIKLLRDQLIHFASLIELELDFGEEDVEFADRNQVESLILQLLKAISSLLTSFTTGKAIKQGVPTVIAGKPNVGKSTLLNALVNEDKAIVSDIAGTTRDFIEDEIIIQGIRFRIIDTAGLRDSSDDIEKLGIARTRSKMKEASLILYLFDLGSDKISVVQEETKNLQAFGQSLISIGNKSDKLTGVAAEQWRSALPDMVFISADRKDGLDILENRILSTVNLGDTSSDQAIVTTARHYESLLKTKESLSAVLHGLRNGVTGDFLAMDIRHALHYLAEISGEITTDDLLKNIFSKFCIGK